MGDQSLRSHAAGVKVLVARRHATDDSADALAQRAVDNLAALDVRAREFVAAHAPSLVIESLDAVDVFYPDADWVNERGPNGEARKKVFDSQRPAFALVYTLVDDRNVVDVIFGGGEPFEADYH